MRRKARYGGLIVVLAALGGGAAYYIKQNGERPDDKYRTEAVSRGTVAETVTTTGSISAVTTVQVGSQVSGIITRLHADFNSPVQKGQLLAELDPTPFEAQVAQRRADLTRSEVEARRTDIDFRRMERLSEEQLVSAADFDAARANVDAARADVDQTRAQLKQAEANLTYTRILSPIDGVVVDRQYDVGQTVAASFQAPTLFTIAQDLTQMQVQADVDQADIGRIEVGQTARFTVDSYPDEEFEGKISQIRLNATVNQNVITYPVILTVVNPEQKLRPKMTANVTIVVSTLDDVLRVPNAALRFRPMETGPPGTGSRSAPPSRAAAEGPGGAGREGRRGSFGALATALDAGAGAEAKPDHKTQTIYLLGEGHDPRPVRVRTGITDGRYTSLVEGEVQVGALVVVGLQTSKVQGAGGFPGAAPPSPGGRRSF